ncbi:hypothetical protein FHS67_006317, partial [Aminobacter aminovorans]|nr:hypothetical protein [Aminobacter aminovorans]MBB6470414.1 hypothetical protein [Aminobacter lissarensis]
MKDIASTDINRFVRDVTAGRTKANVKTKARGR